MPALASFPRCLSFLPLLSLSSAPSFLSCLPLLPLAPVSGLFSCLLPLALASSALPRPRSFLPLQPIHPCLKERAKSDMEPPVDRPHHRICPPPLHSLLSPRLSDPHTLYGVLNSHLSDAGPVKHTPGRATVKHTPHSSFYPHTLAPPSTRCGSPTSRYLLLFFIILNYFPIISVRQPIYRFYVCITSPPPITESDREDMQALSLQCVVLSVPLCHSSALRCLYYYYYHLFVDLGQCGWTPFFILSFSFH